MYHDSSHYLLCAGSQDFSNVSSNFSSRFDLTFSLLRTLVRTNVFSDFIV